MVLAFLTLVAIGLAGVVCAYLTAYHHKPGINIWRGMNPANAVFMPELLTETGLKYRKATLCLYALFIALFVVCMIAAAAN